MYDDEKVSFLYPHKDGSIEEALYELCNSKSKNYEKEWYDILLKRISSSSPSIIQRQPKIVQIIVTENNEIWQGRILGLGDNGVVYTLNNKNEWEGNIWKFAD